MTQRPIADDPMHTSNGHVRSTPAYVVVLAMAFACAPILAICQYANIVRIDDADAAFFAYYGKRLLAGQRLYVDLWDNKPPGIFWIDALGLWISAGKMWGIALVVSLATLGSSVMFFLNARRIFGLATAAIGTVMAALYVNFYYYHVGANRPSTFYVFFELCVLFFYLRSFDGGVSARRNRFSAGAMAACAMCFRQTAFSAAAAIVVHQLYLWIAGRQSRGALARTLVPCVAGGVSAIVAVIGMLAWTGDLGWAWHGVIMSNIGYLTASGQSRVVPTELFHFDDHVRVLGLPAVLALAAVVHTIAMRIFVARETTSGVKLGGPDGVFVLLAAWVPISGYLALIGPHRANHYYGIALAPLVMLATHGVWLLMRRDHGVRTPRYYVILAVFWFVYMAIPVGKLQVQCTMRANFQRFDDRYLDRWGKTIAAIAEHSSPADRLWSPRYMPTVFLAADRPQAHRYLLETLIDQWQERAQPYVDEVIADLKASPPGIIIVSNSELRDMEEQSTPITYRDLVRWLRRNYTPVTQPEHSRVWILND